MTLLLTMLLACGDKDEQADTAVEETQQEESQDTSSSESEDTSSGENEEDTGGEA